MITPKVTGTKVVIGPCRLSYTYVFNKYNPDGDEKSGKYQTSVLIPVKEKETIAAVRKAIDEAKAAGIVSKWGGKEPKNSTCLCVMETTRTMRFMPACCI